MFAQGQAQYKEHFIEANRLASNGNYETAFALLAGEAERDLDCHALGYYWNWCLQFGQKVDDSTYTFPSKTDQVFGKVFIYQFEVRQMLDHALATCPKNGLLNKAKGYQLYLEALEASDLNIEEKKMGGMIAHFKRALQGGANDTITNFYLGQGLEYQSKYGEAIRYYKKAFQLDDGHLQSLLKVAACYGKLSEWDSCYAYADFVLPIAASNLTRATAMRLKAEALTALDLRKPAKKLFNQAMHLSPDNYDNHLAYIDFLYPIKKRRACKEAVALLQKNIYHRHIYFAYEFIFDKTDREEIYNRVEGDLSPNEEALKWLQQKRRVNL
jgi:tetratricopeptide (TPR) repeat protein